MNGDDHSPTDDPDTLIWRMAADSLALAVRTARGIVHAASVHEPARAIAQQRIDALRELAAMLLRETGEMQERLDGSGQIGEFDRIVDGFWDAGDDDAAVEAA